VVGVEVTHLCRPNEIEANDYYFEHDVWLVVAPSNSHRKEHNPESLYFPRYSEELSDYPNGSPRCTMLRNMQYKLVYRPLDVSELYDVVADPQELNNLYGNASYSQVQNGLLFELLEWLFLTSDVTPIQVCWLVQLHTLMWQGGHTRSATYACTCALCGLAWPTESAARARTERAVAPWCQ
jgi:hypothetical protein